ncbi:hypothetical protein D3C79_891220 [compost metagenome]
MGRHRDSGALCAIGDGVSRKITDHLIQPITVCKEIPLAAVYMNQIARGKRQPDFLKAVCNDLVEA